MDKEDVVHIHNGILLNHKKNLNLAIHDNMGEPEGIILAEISQTEENRFHMFSFICGV